MPRLPLVSSSLRQGLTWHRQALDPSLDYFPSAKVIASATLASLVFIGSESCFLRSRDSPVREGVSGGLEGPRVCPVSRTYLMRGTSSRVQQVLGPPCSAGSGEQDSL